MFLDYVGKLSLDDPRLQTVRNVDSHYPATYLFTSYYDFLKDQCEPFYKLLKLHGVNTQMKLYGDESTKQLGHVFHVNMKLEEGRICNYDQIAFFDSLLK